jgi:hypothetical protein
MVVIKRENILFLLLFPLLSLFGKCAGINPLPATKKVATGFLICAVVLTCSIGSFAVFGSLIHESQEFGRFSFSIANVFQLAPSFIKCIVRPEWYGFTAPMVLIGTFSALRKRSILLLIVGLMLSYVTVYLSHLHGYYQIHGVPVAPEGHLRFLMNCMTWWSIVAGAGLALIFERLVSSLRNGRGVTIALCCIYAVTSWVITGSLRREARADELEARIVPAAVANAMAKASNEPVYVVTLEPLIIEMFGSSSTRILGLYRVNNELLARICTGDPRTKLLVLRQSQYEEDRSITRYAENWASLNLLAQRVVYSSPAFSVIVASCRE